MIRPLASVVNSKDHLAVFYDIFSDRLKAIDLSVALVYMIDTCPVTVLPLLADQFHVLGVEGWKFCTTTAQKREFIKNSIAIHKLKGTPYSIKRALELVGFPGATFQEGVDRYYNGDIDYDGTSTYGSTGWAKFRAFVPVQDPDEATDANLALVTAIINEYKPVRCELTEVVFVTYEILTEGSDYLSTESEDYLIQEAS